MTSLKVSPEQFATWRERMCGLGFLDMAAAPNHEVVYERRVRDWVAQGFHADMHWYARGLEKRFDLSLVMDDAASVIILTAPYHPEPVTLAGHKLARYAAGDDYHDVLLKPLIEFCHWACAQIPGAKMRAYVDTGPVLERYWAERAGLGWIGKNGNLISRKAGSYIFLSSIVTNLTVPYGEPHGNFCGTCRACIDACPTEAIVADGMVDSRKCISYLNIEHRGEFPEETPPFDDWVFGCDICQEVCPWPNKFSQESALDAFLPRDAYQDVSGDELLMFEQEQFSTLFRKSPIKRTKMAGVKRNIDWLKREKG